MIFQQFYLQYDKYICVLHVDKNVSNINVLHSLCNIRIWHYHAFVQVTIISIMYLFVVNAFILHNNLYVGFNKPFNFTLKLNMGDTLTDCNSSPKLYKDVKEIIMTKHWWTENNWDKMYVIQQSLHLIYLFVPYVTRFTNLEVIQNTHLYVIQLKEGL